MVYVAKLNQHLHGGVFVFWNPRYPNHVVMQGISKFLIPSLLSLLYPDQESRLIRLNSMLQPAVETVAHNVGAKQIYVAPIGKQGEILKKYYGYHITSKMMYPCQVIKRIDTEYDVYVKDIPSK